MAILGIRSEEEEFAYKGQLEIREQGAETI
jgi:hypothetical protein